MNTFQVPFGLYPSKSVISKVVLREILYFIYVVQPHKQIFIPHRHRQKTFRFFCANI